MKAKIAWIVIAVILAIALYSAIINNREDVEKAKQQLQDGETSQTINAWDTTEEEDEEQKEEPVSMIIAETEDYLIERVTMNQSIVIDENMLDTADFSWDTAVILDGTADDSIEEISVEFSNLESDFKNDNYTLNTYNKWNEKFRYIASPKLQVLDKWDNVYLITASGKESESITRVTIRIKWNESEKKSSFTGSMNDLSFPKWNFWEAIILDETTVYYSDLKGLEIMQDDVSAVSCTAPVAEDELIPNNDLNEDDSEEEKAEAVHPITSFLIDKYSTWVYWNTCRPLVQDSLIAFNVIRLTDNEGYKYEKHYIDFNSSLHWVMELESWTGVTKENIGEKNSEFRDKTFDITDITDELFQKIISENRD